MPRRGRVRVSHTVSDQIGCEIRQGLALFLRVVAEADLDRSGIRCQLDPEGCNPCRWTCRKGGAEHIQVVLDELVKYLLMLRWESVIPCGNLHRIDSRTDCVMLIGIQRVE